MSESSPASGPRSSGSAQQQQQQQQQQQRRGGIDDVDAAIELRAGRTIADPNVRDAGSRHSRSWHPSPVVEPVPEPTQPRLLGVHTILNPPDAAASNVQARRISREVSDGSLPAASRPSQQRKSLSPAARFARPSAQHLRVDRPLSPGTRPRRIITPVSPAARLGKFNTFPGKINVSESLFVQEPPPGIFNVPPGVPLSTEPTSNPNMMLSGRLPPSQPSRHSTPTFHSRRTSLGLQTNPSSQDNSPSTPHSSYSQFGQSSPILAQGLLQLPGPSSLEPPLFPMDSLNRLSANIGGQKYGEDLPVPGAPQDVAPFPGMIPVEIDLKSGSRSQAEKRKANSDASRRFRNRKKNELALEQKLKSQAEELRMVLEEREFYRAERDFFRESLGQLTQLPTRPPSPRHFRPVSEQLGNEPGLESGWRTGESVPKSTTTSPATSSSGPILAPGVPSTPRPISAPSGVMAGSSADPSTYSTPTSGGLNVAPDDGQLQHRVAYQGQWTSVSTIGDPGGGQTHRGYPSSSTARESQHQNDPFERSWNPRP
jgi:hypothetical protein